MNVLFVGFKYDYGKISRGESLEKKAFLPALKNNSDSCSAFWLEENGYPENIKGLQDNIIKHVNNKNPDLIFFILMNNEISESTLSILTSKYKTLNWFCDDQWRFDSFSSKIAHLFNYIVTVDKFSLEKYKLLTHKAILSQWATFDYQYNLVLDKIEYKYDVTFVGSKNITREWIIHKLKKRGINVICFGEGWEYGRISYNQMKMIFLTSKINLNLSNSTPNNFCFYIFLFKKIFSSIFNPMLNLKNKIKAIKEVKSYLFSKKNIEQIKARNFEIPGCGGFQLSKFALEIDDYYKIGEEIALFSEFNELEISILYYLTNFKEREKIKEMGYKRTSQHTYDKRIFNILKDINLYD